MFTVYLAGPMKGVKYKDANEWRKNFIELYIYNSPLTGMDYNVHFLSPLRGKGGQEALIDDDAKADVNDSLVERNSIVEQDYNDIRRSFAIVVNLQNTTVASIGTCFELSLAKELRKPVIAITDDDNVHNHPFVDNAISFKVKSIKEAAIVLKQLIG